MSLLAHNITAKILHLAKTKNLAVQESGVDIIILAGGESLIITPTDVVISNDRSVASLAGVAKLYRALTWVDER